MSQLEILEYAIKGVVSEIVKEESQELRDKLLTLTRMAYDWKELNLETNSKDEIK